MIWKLNTTPKLKQFLWRLLSNSLAIGTNLKRRCVIRDAQCRRCCQEEKSPQHFFFIVTMRRQFEEEQMEQIQY